ncbi:hypothetical protein KFK09_014053 [Dendrobium nobile]|uniref:Aspartyl aminopeptidase n=1 Tax=Dendrobium nobile TaxID=94219 RepID=A0A8T3BAM5_DENNO|nr:hypothetical protein KFK09_014053 [Dendrobium nobile]
MATAELVSSKLVDFLNASPTAFHVVDEVKRRLKKVGFEQVLEREDWNLELGKKYFFTRNHSTIVAFAIGKRYVARNGFRIIGAYTDSPCLKLKPTSKVAKGGYLEVGVQTYGGGLWHTWFDRDLTVAGRLIVKEMKDGSVSYTDKLIRIQEPIMWIPTLAIHLDIYALAKTWLNTQSHLVPILATSVKNGPIDAKFKIDGIKSHDKKIIDDRKHHSIFLQTEEICDFELQLCDTPQSIIGCALKEFIFSGRLDNLCMSFCSLKALIDSTSFESSLDEEIGVRMVALFDHEELVDKAIQQSFLVSADMAHAIHPNHMDKHEDNHQPKLHGGLGIKHNANQRYATNAITSFIFREIAERHDLPIQVIYFSAKDYISLSNGLC